MSKKPSLAHLEKHQDTERTPLLSLVTEQGKILQLDERKLEQWFARVEQLSHPKAKINQNETELSNQFTSRFGLQSASNVIEFLNSPEGETTKGLIHKHLIEMVEQEEQIQETAREKQRRRQIGLAYFLMALLHRKKAHAKTLHAWQDATEQQLQQSRALAAKAAEESERSKQNEELDSFDLSIEMLHEFMKENEQNRHAIQSQQKSIEQHDEDINNRYDSLLHHINELNEQLEGLTGNDLQQMEHLEKIIASFEQRLELSEKNTAQQIQTLLEDGQETGDQQAKALIAKQQGLYAQLDGLKSMQAVLQGNKEFLDAEGKSCTSFKNAMFIVPKNGSTNIVKDQQGNYYMLTGSQTLATLSHDEKAAAKEKFKQAQPDLLVAKELAKHNEKLEKDFSAQRKNEFKLQQSPKIDKLQQEMTLLQNQLRLMQAARAELSSQTPQAGQQQTNSSKAGMTVNKPATTSSLITILQNNPTQAAITQFNNQVSALYGKQADPVLGITSRLTPDKTIPPQVLRQLIIKLDILGLHDYSKITKQSENKAAREAVRPTAKL